MHITILPADTYVVINKTVLNEQDRKIITMLYQPIIGFAAVSLYFTLIDDLDKKEVRSDELTHHHLMATMQLKLDEIVIAREKLEGVGLLKTYYRQDNVNNYVYLLYSPISANDFFNHPILNIVLYNNLGKEEYNKLLNVFRIPRIVLKDYKDITRSFDEVFSSVPGRSEILINDVASKSTSNIFLNNSIDFDMLISSIPKDMVNEKCFTDEVKELINNLVFTYHIDQFHMQDLVRDSLNEKGLVDKNELRKNCRNIYQLDNSGSLPTLVYSKQPEYLKKPVGDNSKWAKMVYTFENTTPYNYLKAQYKGSEPTSRDLRLIEGLLVEHKLNPGVVNVLISYVLKINNQKLSKNYIETIVGQWKRLKVETVEDAMRVTEKEHKKLKKLINKDKTTTVSTRKYSNRNIEEKLPDWFDKEIESSETSKQEQDEMEKLLKDFS